MSISVEDVEIRMWATVFAAAAFWAVVGAVVASQWFGRLSRSAWSFLALFGYFAAQITSGLLLHGVVNWGTQFGGIWIHPAGLAKFLPSIGLFLGGAVVMLAKFAGRQRSRPGGVAA